MDERVAGPTQFGEMPAAVGVSVVWLYFLVVQGPLVGLEASWLLLIGLALGGWTLGMRVRYSPTSIAMTIGPWRRRADLTALESIHWKMTGGWRSLGTIFIRDRKGHKVPIYVGRFKRADEWCQVLLEAANRTGAEVDRHSRHILEHAGRSPLVPTDHD